MTNVLYSIERDLVDPVFFAVVPDSFMTRMFSGQRAPSPRYDVGDWPDEQATPLVAPHDRWSF